MPADEAPAWPDPTSSGFPADVPCHWPSGCRRGVAAWACTLAAASGLSLPIGFQACPRVHDRHLPFVSLGSLSLVLPPLPCRSTSGSASVAGLSPCATDLPVLPSRYGPVFPAHSFPPGASRSGASCQERGNAQAREGSLSCFVPPEMKHPGGKTHGALEGAACAPSGLGRRGP